MSHVIDPTRPRLRFAATPLETETPFFLAAQDPSGAALNVVGGRSPVEVATVQIAAALASDAEVPLDQVPQIAVDLAVRTIVLARTEGAKQLEALRAELGPVDRALVDGDDRIAPATRNRSLASWAVPAEDTAPA